MKITGIIAEYNPFHSGHAYQLEELRRRTQADYIIAAMSGDFVQRGAPAILDKHTRARMALACGVDLVIELPALWSCASAESFAAAGVLLLEKTGCVDTLCFGAETDDLTLLSAVADILSDEPPAFRDTLAACLKRGLSFPAARQEAVCACAGPAGLPAAAAGVMGGPNNILAIEYLKALKKYRSSIRPLMLKRRGAGYHDTRISDAPSHTFAPAASASAIRQLLLARRASLPGCMHEKTDVCRSSVNRASLPDPARKTDVCRSSVNRASLPDPAREETERLLAASMPPAALSILSEALRDKPLLDTDDFSLLTGFRLLSTTPGELADTAGCTEAIANRLYRQRYHFASVSSFCAQNRTRDVTYTRLSRILHCLLLGITKADEAAARENGLIPWLRILGFRRTSAPLLTLLKRRAEVPILTKLADAEQLLDPPAFALLKKDMYAGELYRQVQTVIAAAHEKGGDEGIPRPDHLHADHLHADHLHADHLHADHLHADHLHADHLRAENGSSRDIPRPGAGRKSASASELSQQIVIL